MDFFSGLGWLATGWILPVLGLFTIIVFVHELGHFLVARWCGVGVEVFSIGFGPELFGWNDRRGTRWKISAIPLGGYVKFLGDANVASGIESEALAEMPAAERARTFAAQPVGKRAAIVFAGPAANFLLAIAILAGFFAFTSRVEVEPVIGFVTEGSAAAEAGLQPGDRFVSVDGEPVSAFRDVTLAILTSTGLPLNVTVDRGGEQLSFVVTPRWEAPEGDESRWIFGMRADPDLAPVVLEPLSLPSALIAATDRAWFIVTSTFKMIGGMLAGRESVDQLAGPIAVAQLANQAATAGVADWIELIAFISISIGIANLLPIPMLDGGHLLFYAYEAVRRRPASRRVQELALRIGVVLLLGLMIFAFTNDIARLLT